MPKRKDTKPPSAMPSRIVNAVPDLSADQRRDLRSRNQEELMAHPKLVNGRLTEHLIATALGEVEEASPSERNQAMTVITSAFYGKHVGQEEEKPVANNINLTINGQQLDMRSGGFIAAEPRPEGLTKEQEVMAIINGTAEEKK